MSAPLRAAAVVGLALAAATMAGCMPSSAAYPYSRDVVWQAAVAESIVWRPYPIEEDKHRVTSEKVGLAGEEMHYELEVKTDANPFARRPSTRVFVSMVQKKPKRRQFREQEQAFLQKLRATLDAQQRGAR